MDKVDAVALKKYLHYNKETGIFTWIYHDKKPEIVGRVAGCREKRIGYEAYAYALSNPESVKSKMEEKVKSGLPVGVAYKERDGLYEVKICHNKQKVYCGCFKKLEDAIKRANEARPLIKSGKPYDYKQKPIDSIL